MDNLIEGAVVTLVDISERKQAEEALRLTEARLHGFVQQAYAGVSEIGPDGRFLFVNDRLCELLGYDREGLLHRRQGDLTDAQDLSRALEQQASLAQGGPDYHIDKRYVRRNGTRVWVHERVSAIRDGGERPTTFLTLAFEVPERKP